MSTKQLGPAKQAAADRKKLNVMIREMVDNPEKIDYAALSQEHSNRLLVTANRDLKNVMHAFNEKHVKFMQDSRQKLMILRKGTKVLMAFEWNTDNLKNQLTAVKKLREFYEKHKDHIDAIDIPLLTEYKAIVRMIGRVPESYDSSIEGLDEYLDHFEEIALPKFKDIICFHKMTHALADGKVRQVRKNENFMELAHHHFMHHATIMFGDSLPVLGERIKIRNKIKKDQ